MVGGEGPIACGWDFCSSVLQGEHAFLFIFRYRFFFSWFPWSSDPPGDV